ncbi:DUF4142 domain-containing protein [Pedobacter sp. SD-b]|uniref:DUF4142 domain-containing protein n=1 Tax=Pedobacter segetis TaxID=2793069 RepID=A0ABS1BLK9_9SPHI|nr:DUF4142 domain-containing protein [Pedobacter segetis]MBK0383779.1 DUF4142 domain-containing protein [Pedobacter segetis]
MKKLILTAAIGLVALSFQACNNQQASTDTKDSLDSLNDQSQVMTTDDGSEFLTEAASGGMMEVDLGKLAQTNAMSSRVKDFGNMMVTDHSKANDDLKQLAMTKNVSLPDMPMKDQQDHIADLKSKIGKDFDKAYMSMMVKDHEDDIDKFEDAAKGKDADVAAFANKVLPTLRVHLDSAKAINDAIK